MWQAATSYVNAIESGIAQAYTFEELNRRSAVEVGTLNAYKSVLDQYRIAERL